MGKCALTFDVCGVVCGKMLCLNAAGQAEREINKHSLFRPRYFRGAANRINLPPVPLSLRADHGFRRGSAAAVTERERQRTGALGAMPPQKLRFCCRAKSLHTLR